MPTGTIHIAAFKTGETPAQLVARVFRENNGNFKRTAKTLGVTRSTVRYWLRVAQEAETHEPQ